MHCCNINKSRRGDFLVHLVVGDFPVTFATGKLRGNWSKWNLSFSDLLKANFNINNYSAYCFATTVHYEDYLVLTRKHKKSNLLYSTYSLLHSVLTHQRDGELLCCRPV